MCGLAGFWDPRSSLDAARLSAIARAMADRLAHRGPDDAGSWADPQAGLALGHRRLSIIDLSPQGAQPMSGRGGRYVIAYNGEMYNFAALRRALDPVPWRGHCDTEVLLEAVAQWGIDAALQEALGMFAFALWDKAEQRLHLARDRMGEKPLYYGLSGGVLLFASELKAFAAHPAWRPEIDRDALAAYFRYGWIPAPHSIYRGVRKLVPGNLLTLGAKDLQMSNAGTLPAPKAYWSLERAARLGRERPFRGSEQGASDELERLLSEAVKGQMISDVPLGAFLSGGIDSSTIVALMQKASARPVRTFAIGFEEARFDESRHARAVAGHLGTEHRQLIVSPQQLIDAVPGAVGAFDEPFADSSQIPTLLVAGLARQSVTVSLSGDGGDELFGGYHRHRSARFALCALRAPRALRLAIGMLSVPARKLLAGSALIDARLRKIEDLLASSSLAQAYGALVSLGKAERPVVPGAREPAALLERVNAFSSQSAGCAVMLSDAAYYLPDDILVKLDRAAMAHSLESRAPFLDHRVVEFACSLPESFKLGAGVGKRILRQVLARHVPRALFERPKMGFSLPLADWLRGPLRDWAETLLAQEALAKSGLIDPAPIRDAWSEHLAGRGNWQHLLWAALTFQRWHEAQQGWLGARFEEPAPLPVP